MNQRITTITQTPTTLPLQLSIRITIPPLSLSHVVCARERADAATAAAAVLVLITSEPHPAEHVVDVESAEPATAAAIPACYIDTVIPTYYIEKLLAKSLFLSFLQDFFKKAYMPTLNPLPCCLSAR